MAIKTNIEWCDSTVNGQMGCDGCELWNKRTGEGTCYAATLTERYAGGRGWPNSFGEPAMFPERIVKACGWPDLAGTERPEKPWLNGYPRLNFLDDMGDTFTESLPLDWLAPLIPQMAAAPAIWMMLTKRGARMRRFWKSYGPVPQNFWLMVSVTSPASLGRAEELLKIPAAVKLISFEPVVEPVYFGGERGALGCYVPDTAKRRAADRWRGPFRGSAREGVDGVIVGGESGAGARPLHVLWVRSIVDQCRAAGAACFVKQLGSNPYEYRGDEDVSLGATALGLRDPKGGDWNEWPAALRVRELPPAPVLGQARIFG